MKMSTPPPPPPPLLEPLTRLSDAQLVKRDLQLMLLLLLPPSPLPFPLLHKQNLPRISMYSRSNVETHNLLEIMLVDAESKC